MNLVVLQGNLTREPELRTVNVGEKTTSVVNFTLAVTTRRWKKPDGTYGKETYFASCEAWDSGAELIGKMQKGDPLLIRGVMRNDRWEDADGNPRSREKVRVEFFQLLGRREKREESNVEEDE